MSKREGSDRFLEAEGFWYLMLGNLCLAVIKIGALGAAIAAALAFGMLRYGIDLSVIEAWMADEKLAALALIAVGSGMAAYYSWELIRHLRRGEEAGGAKGSIEERIPSIWEPLRAALWLSLFIPGTAGGSPLMSMALAWARAFAGA